MIDPLIAKTLATGFGLLFLLAAVHKLTALRDFRATLEAYRLPPAALVTPVAWITASAELLLGVGWLAGFRPALTAAASAALLFVYTLAMAVNIVRGRVHIDCGCSFGRSSAGIQQLSKGLLFRNSVLIAATVVATLPVATRTLGPADYLVLFAALAALTLAYAAGNQLLTNFAAIGAWRNAPSKAGKEAQQ